MTRHQRRRRAKAIAEARARKSIVAANLAKPVERQFIRGRLVSGVYSGEQDRARGMGVTPMTHKVSRVLSDAPYASALGSRAQRKVIRRENGKLVTQSFSVEGCGWKV